jgi:UDP-N-acetylmuramate: L-alanyl-gamma-D-glutamyl-meso-diaminopimelate ligase
MHNLALELQRKGNTITGSDDEIYEPSKQRLDQAHLLPKEMGWFPERITADLDAVILGMHAKPNNVELLRAQELGIKIYSYPEFIFEQSQDKHRVVIAGSHGKTTITSMILHVLHVHNRKYNYLVGAKIEGFENMVYLSDDSPVVIMEGDEYFSSPIDPTPKFLHYQPHIALISGIAWDHYNVFPTWEKYVQQFEILADSLPKAGVLLYDETDDMLDVIGQKERADISNLAYSAHPYHIVAGKTFLKTQTGMDVPLQVFGEHNMKNITGAMLVCEILGITKEQFYQAISSFKGASKRLELLGSNDHVNIYRDFAHAPSKVEATTAAVKSQFPDRKLVACAELHTFSSLNKAFLSQYHQKLDAADVAIVYYNLHTLETKELDPISASELKDAFQREDLHVFTNTVDLLAFLETQHWVDSNLLLMSSGTFGGLDAAKLSQQILK